MEIENKNLGAVSTQQSGASQTPRPADERSGEDSRLDAPPPADQVSLTPQAQQLRQLETAIAEQPVVDQSRVEAVRQALNEGRFEVDAERIAERLVNLERALNDAG